MTIARKVGSYTLYKNKAGFTTKVTNSKGKAGTVHIVQRGSGPTGFTIIKGRRKIGFGRTEPAALKKAVSKGYKTVEFLD
jgi:hypothetical protein